MRNYINLKSFLLLSVLILADFNSVQAMEKDDDKEERGHGNGKKAALVAPGERHIPQIDESEGFQFLEAHLLNLLQQGAQASEQHTRISLFKQCLDCLEISYNTHLQFVEAKEMPQENQFSHIILLWNVTSNFYSTLSKRVPLSNKEIIDFLFSYLTKAIDINHFLALEVEALIPEQQQKFDINLGYYNFLMHISSYLTNFQDKITSKEELKKLVTYASKYYSKIKSHPKYNQGDMATKIYQNIRSEAERMLTPGTRAPGGRKVEIQRKKNRIEQKYKFLETAHQSHKLAGGMYNPVVLYESVISLKNSASLDWDLKKDAHLLVEGHKNAYEKLRELEAQLAAKLEIIRGPEDWEVEDYRMLYQELQKHIPLKSLKEKDRFYEFLAISINSGDLKSSELRLELFAQLMGGSVANFDQIPNTLKPLYAMLRYLQGQPEVWEMYTERLEKEKEKKRKDRIKKAAKKKVEQVRSELESVHEKEAQKVTQGQKETSGTKKEAPTVPTILASAHSETELLSEEQTTSKKAEAKRAARDALEKIESKKQKKDGKKHEPNKQEEAHQVAPSLFQPPQVPVEALYDVTSTTRKLHENLYSLAPQLSTEQAVQLLGGFGLTITSGNGSHTKCTFNNGETIATKDSKVVWQCPDFEGATIIVPRWDRKDIPDYMVKHLKHILEKIGVKPDSL